MTERHTSRSQEKNSPEMRRLAVIYCRVSSGRQLKEGDGLNSQETRCREFARNSGYEVAAVFHEEGVSGGLVNRPAMKEMLAFLRKNRKYGPYLVIIDDINRLARKVLTHIELSAAITTAGGKLVSPNMEFGEDSDSKFREHLMASVSEHQRAKNTEQSRNRMRARLMNGYWVFQAPVGYRYQAVAGRGKMLVRDEPIASIVQEALEGYAAGRFETPTEVQRFFLEITPSFPRKMHLQGVLDILNRPIYAGYVEKPDWGIERRKGNHEPLISYEVYDRIQLRLKRNAKAPARKDLHRDFPLRGFVTCAACGKPLTGSWSTGRSAKYAYYACHNKQCPEHRKSIPKKPMEDAFETLLLRLKPANETLDTAEDMLRTEWQKRQSMATEQHKTVKAEIKELDRKIQQLMERIGSTDKEEIVVLYEDQISKLNERKILLVEKSTNIGKPTTDFDETLRTVRRFLSNPSVLWHSNQIENQRIVLRLAFDTKLAYSRNEGFRTAEITTPFKLLEDHI